MNALVYYATRSGNTRQVAEAIADGLRSAGTAGVRSVDDGPEVPEEVDLVVVGGPTEGHGMSVPMTRFLDRLPDRALAGRAAAAFDTRLDWPRWLSGSAAARIRQRLEHAGARPTVETASFIVSMKPEISPDELERARRWGVALVSDVPSTTLAAPAPRIERRVAIRP